MGYELSVEDEGRYRGRSHKAVSIIAYTLYTKNIYC
jgi:hypothetical protein